MTLPIVAILGRPNVGKSTLFNRLVGRKAALVEDRPGVTRDRHYGEGDWAGRHFTVVDTGGFTEGEKEPLAASVRRQAEKALAEAAVAVLVVDARAGIMPDDRVLADAVRRSGRPVLVAANKIDDGRSEARSELDTVHGLGFPDVFPVSAEHGRGVNELLDAVLERLPEEKDPETADDGSHPDASGEAFSLPPAPRRVARGRREGKEREEAAEDDGIPRIAVVGRPNAGKSTLLNRLLDDDRLVVSEVPGTTRDAIEVEMTRGGKVYRFIDTAGIRRKAAHGDTLEQESAELAEGALERSDVVVVLFDATEPAVEQDSRLIGACLKLGKPLVMAANKSDLLRRSEARKALGDAVDENLRFVFSNAPMVELSALDGTGLPKLLQECSKLYDQSKRRIPTPELNRFLQEAEAAHPAPRYGGHPVRLYYMTQVSVRPPTFLFHVNRPEGITEAYRRFLENRMRERWNFQIPLRLVFKRRRR